jgi:hypothetical protein
MQDHADDPRGDHPAPDGSTPGQRSGHGARSLWEQIHSDEQRRENSDPEANAGNEQPQQQRPSTD